MSHFISCITIILHSIFEMIGKFAFQILKSNSIDWRNIVTYLKGLVNITLRVNFLSWWFLQSYHVRYTYILLKSIFNSVPFLASFFFYLIYKKIKKVLMLACNCMETDLPSINEFDRIVYSQIFSKLFLQYAFSQYLSILFESAYVYIY